MEPSDKDAQEGCTSSLAGGGLIQGVHIEGVHENWEDLGTKLVLTPVSETCIM